MDWDGSSMAKEAIDCRSGSVIDPWVGTYTWRVEW